MQGSRSRTEPVEVLYRGMRVLRYVDQEKNRKLDKFRDRIEYHRDKLLNLGYTEKVIQGWIRSGRISSGLITVAKKLYQDEFPSSDVYTYVERFLGPEFRIFPGWTLARDMAGPGHLFVLWEYIGPDVIR